MTGIVFVIDQDVHLAKLVSSVLVPAGIDVSGYCSGHAALTAMETLSPDLLIVGERNTESDGVGWVAKLREVQHRIPVAFVASRWRDPEFYRTLKDDLSVALIAHRPLKPSVLKAQLSDLLAIDWRNEAEPEEIPITFASDANGLNSSPAYAKWRRMFIASIPQRMERLGSLLTALSLTNDRVKIIAEATIIAHNLKGTALSWGFTELGDAAARMENVLQQDTGSGAFSSSIVEDAAMLFHLLNEETRVLSADPDISDIMDEIPELAADKAHVLLVGTESLPCDELSQRAGIGVEVIQTTYEKAIEAAEKVALDAALIEVPELGQTEQCFNLARRLRDLPGYENLPMAFIVPAEAGAQMEGAARAHAGGSIVVGRPVDGPTVDMVIGRLLSLAEGGRFRVLVVDDDADMSSLVCRCLGQFGIIARSLSDPLQVMNVLNEFNPDLLLLDVMMPGMSGFEVCKKLRSGDRWRDLPIIFLTAQTDLPSRITAYEAGADDYLPKPVINVELLTRVKARLEKSRELKERSERDLLTGLLMRRPFSEQVNGMISEATRHGLEFTIALLDVDYFKQVNDSYGHDAGDLVLATVGKLLRRRFRVEDVRGRWGGEEFILAFRHENLEVMKRALTRVMDELRSIEFPCGDKSFRVSFSAGLSAFPRDEQTLQGLVQVADRRLYLAKTGGRSLILTEG
ncbi:MAG: diguanylate cyclase [Candidatus Obscuribacterales bacterium]|nr:diguanylate cyclase [Candidatus Obscuribacterales bacterium]